MVGTRRALLLGAGATALVAAGCGPADEPEVHAADVLAQQLRAEQAVVAAYEAIGDDDLSIPDNWRSQTLLARTRARITKLDAALRGEGGVPGGPLEKPANAGLEAVLEAERRALRVHVRAVGQLQEPKWRELLADLVASSAAHETALLQMLERPPLPSAFPGQPV